MTERYQQQWQRFLEARLVAPTDYLSVLRPADQRGHLVFLLPLQASPVGEYVQRLQSRLGAIPGVSLAPSGFLHVTVKEVGPLVDRASAAGEWSAEQLTPLLEQAREALSGTTPFSLRLGAVNSFATVAFVEVDDGGAIHELHLRLCDVAGVVSRPTDGHGFLPHVTIAGYGTDAAFAPLEAALTALRREPALSLAIPVERVVLVNAFLRSEKPTWQVVGTIPLAQARRTDSSPEGTP